jgi:D-arabinose 5-phosphate isomerase GutQ
MGNSKDRLQGHTARSKEVERTASILEKKGYHVTKVTDKKVSVIAPISGAVIQLRDQLDLQRMEKLGIISMKKVVYHGHTEARESAAA